MSATKSVTGSGIRLVIVDDSNIIRNRIARVVEKGLIPDVTVVGMARDGYEALKLCQESRPDLVTMDLTMPAMDGVRCIEQLVQMQPSVRILVISALKDKATALSALQKGADGFVCKPFTDMQLADAFNDLREDK